MSTVNGNYNLTGYQTDPLKACNADNPLDPPYVNSFPLNSYLNRLEKDVFQSKKKNSSGKILLDKITEVFNSAKKCVNNYLNPEPKDDITKIINI